MKKLLKRVLAEGESTGHAHVVDCDVFQDEDIRVFSSPNQITITHEEHNPQVFPPNEYNSDRIVEFDHLQKLSRKVSD